MRVRSLEAFSTWSVGASCATQDTYGVRVGTSLRPTI